jgi:hypothetical protein
MKYDAEIEQYLAGPGLLRRAVAGRTGDHLLARPIPGKWSTQEVVFHLADYEPIYADRMKRVIALEEPALLPGDPALFAARLAYGHRNVESDGISSEVSCRRPGPPGAGLPAGAPGYHLTRCRS